MQLYHIIKIVNQWLFARITVLLNTCAKILICFSNIFTITCWATKFIHYVRYYTFWHFILSITIVTLFFRATNISQFQWYLDFHLYVLSSEFYFCIGYSAKNCSNIFLFKYIGFLSIFPVFSTFRSLQKTS